MDRVFRTFNGVEYIRRDEYSRLLEKADRLEEGSSKLAHKYEELLNIISAIKSDVDEIDTQQETDAFSDLTQAHDIPY